MVLCGLWAPMGPYGPLKIDPLYPTPDRSPAMPPKTSRLAKSADRKNTALIKGILADSSGAVFARVEANLGPKFRVAIFNTSSKTVFTAFGSPRGLFRQKKAGIVFQTNDIVVLSSLPQPNELCEIIGLIERKDASQLYKDGQINKVIFTPVETETSDAVATEDIFDYDEEVNMEDL